MAKAAEKTKGYRHLFDKAAVAGMACGAASVADSFAPVGAEDSFAQAGETVACVALGRELCCGGMCRPAVEYSGYTWIHLPVTDGFLCRKWDAMPAIFAARMARSSLLSRSFCK